MTPNWIWTLNTQNYSVYIKYLPQRSKFWCVLLYDYPFPRYNTYKVGENRKCTEWPQTELDDSAVKSTLYTLNTYPWGPNFGPFRFMISGFQDTKSSKIGNASSDPKLNLNTQQSKVLYIHVVLTPEAQLLVLFALRPSVSKISHILSFPIDYHVKRPKKE